MQAATSEVYVCPCAVPPCPRRTLRPPRAFRLQQFSSDVFSRQRVGRIRPPSQNNHGDPPPPSCRRTACAACWVTVAPTTTGPSPLILRAPAFSPPNDVQECGEGKCYPRGSHCARQSDSTSCCGLAHAHQPGSFQSSGPGSPAHRPRSICQQRREQHDAKCCSCQAVQPLSILVVGHANGPRCHALCPWIPRPAVHYTEHFKGTRRLATGPPRAPHCGLVTGLRGADEPSLFATKSHARGRRGAHLETHVSRTIDHACQAKDGRAGAPAFRACWQVANGRAPATASAGDLGALFAQPRTAYRAGRASEEAVSVAARGFAKRGGEQARVSEWRGC